MASHHHSENPWRVRVDDADGSPCGAGVLLDERHVLTCAHVVRYAGAAPEGSVPHVRISSVACHPEWSRTARVAPESWVHRNGTRRGDVALLELDEPTDCGTRTALWQAPISGGRVRVYGFPAAEPYGIGTDAELAGSGGREGEWGLLNQVHAGGPWIERGYSGAGVMALGGEFDGRVIGIVVADYVNGGARAAWMLPTEAVLAYLPQIGPAGGGRANRLGPAGADWPDDVLGDTLRLALTQELTRLLDGGWSGTVVVRTGGATGTGDSWLVRLVRTADPAARATVTDAELTDAPGDTVLGLGAIDAAFDARGRSAAEVRGYLADRFGLRRDDPGFVRQFLRLRPAPCVVVAGIDRATDPDVLMAEVLGPLAARARSRGIRLVLGFEGPPPAGLAHEVSLDPEPLTGGSPAGSHGVVSAAAAAAAVERLAAEETAAARLQTEWGLKFFAPPQLPQSLAPRLRVRLAVARGTEPNGEVTAVHEQAVAARAAVARYDRDLRRLADTCEDLRQSLELQRMRAARYYGDEDRQLAVLHAPAARGLRTPPIDLVAARTLVERYTDEVNRRIGAQDRARGRGGDAGSGGSGGGGSGEASDGDGPGREGHGGARGGEG
ncbi:trypsin-like peptidase domain-containing protein [Streptomyces sp. V4-01]|uniref:Trypsin-like peptidase domain-containing protein n=1 Tax=Actinacidiphila polyblastidii TaxID=3110430 RepID=A0ABU7PGZ2_9ACTN|nr:trypsin-like peptidase domain-containing protein [Streptomyces sp. V4-01]